MTTALATPAPVERATAGGADLFPATAPAEARGLERDAVRLLVAWRDGNARRHGQPPRRRDGNARRHGQPPRRDRRPDVHARLRDLPRFLRRGDLLVVNASAVLPASLPAGDAGSPRRLHLSTELGAGRWLVEVRLPHGDASTPLLDARAGQRLDLPAGGTARLLEPYDPGTAPEAGTRLWVAEVSTPGTVHGFLWRHGRPIRYGSPVQPWPLAAYQTVFATEPGSAESPSAGRGFTPALVTRLRRDGVGVAPVVLHTGVSSQESGEPPYPERYRVPAATARAVEATRAGGGRVVAVGTTVTRALETVARPGGTVEPGSGWTDLVVTPARGVRVVDGLLSGWHEPAASHLQLLEAVAGRAALERAYAAAVAAGYRGHEFGDLLLLLP